MYNAGQTLWQNSKNALFAFYITHVNVPRNGYKVLKPLKSDIFMSKDTSVSSQNTVSHGNAPQNDLADVPVNCRLESYRFELPSEQIAQEPAQKRGSSRLFVLNRKDGTNRFAHFSELADYLPKNALLVVNNSRVLPARLYGVRPNTGGRVEFLLLTPLPLVEKEEQADGSFCATVNGLLKASKRIRLGDKFHFEAPHTENMTDSTENMADNATNSADAAVQCLDLEVCATGEFGNCSVIMRWRGDLPAFFFAAGHLPLPPYIRRPDTAEDRERYQTSYAREDRLGSVAAPTAGLHFTPELREELTRSGIGWAEVTLYVGYGTFSPVRTSDIREHAMHKEYIEVTEENAAIIAKAKAEGRPVVSVGTTSTRVLESVYAACGKVCAYNGWTNIFIYPPYEFKVADHMITNFHLPESSLLMMLSAFAGRERMLDAYSDAVREKFRFFSYGDAMLVL